MRELDLTIATIYTQLLQQGLDAEFEADFPERTAVSLPVPSRDGGTGTITATTN